MTVNDVLGVGGAAILISIIVEVILRAWQPPEGVKDRFGPLLALIVGQVVVVGFAVAQAAPLDAAILTGILAGASAMGLHDTVS